MSVLADPRPEKVMQFRQATLPPRLLTVGVTVTDKDGAGIQVVPHKEILVGIGTSNCPEMVTFTLPFHMARDLFTRGIAMCDAMDGAKL